MRDQPAVAVGERNPGRWPHPVTSVGPGPAPTPGAGALQGDGGRAEPDERELIGEGNAADLDRMPVRIIAARVDPLPVGGVNDELLPTGARVDEPPPPVVRDQHRVAPRPEVDQTGG